MRNLSTARFRPIFTRLALAAMMLSLLPLRLPAQVTATDQEIGMLREEMGVLRMRMADLEARLMAFTPAAAPARDQPIANTLAPPSRRQFPVHRLLRSLRRPPNPFLSPSVTSPG
jgi:hypothetical protein